MPHHTHAPRRFTRLVTLATLLGALLLGLFLLPPPALAAPAITLAPAADPAGVVQQFFAAFNRGDVPAALALMTPDVRFVGGPCTDGRPCMGTEAVRQFLQGGIAVHSQFTPVGAPVVVGTTVRQRTEVRFDQLAGTGVDRIIVDVTAEVRDNKIASFVQKEDLSDPQTARFLSLPRPTGPMPGLPNTGGGGLAARPLGDQAGLLGVGALLGAFLLAAATRRRAKRWQ